MRHDVGPLTASPLIGPMRQCVNELMKRRRACRVSDEYFTACSGEARAVSVWF